MLGLKYNLTVEERFNYDRKMQSSLALLYIVNVFTYSLAIVLISYQQYVNFKDHLTPEYQLLIDNWNENPINNVSLQTSSTQVYANISGSIADKLIIANNSNIAFRYNKLSSYNFLNNFNLLPYCKSNQFLCGGVDHATKLCIPNDHSLCPYNQLKLYAINQNYTKDSFDDYYQQFNNAILLGSSYQSEMSIVNIRLGFNDQVCVNQNEFINCSRKALNYQLIRSNNASDFFTQNNIVYSQLKINDTVGLFVQKYVKFNIECRATLIERLYEGINYYQRMGYILYIQTITALVYCGLIGLVINIIHFLLLSDFQFILVLPSQDQNTLKLIRKILIIIRVLAFLPFAFFICFEFFMQSQMYDTLQRILKDNCIEQGFNFIIQDNINQIEQFKPLQNAIFWIFIASVCIEMISIFVVLYRSVNLKKKNLIQLQYENELEINHDLVQQFYVEPKEKPKIRASFTPAEQRAIRQSIVNVGGDQNYQPKSQLSRIEDNEEENENDQQQFKESSRPVWNESIRDRKVTYQTPTNKQQQNNKY